MKPRPTVAIVGRPNVGKSTLFNRITQKRRAIVHEMPGVTRDVQRGETEWTGIPFEILDTGGLFSGVDDDLITQVEQRAIAEAMAADVLVLVVDATTGLVSADREVVDQLRDAKAHTLLVVNKVERKDTLHSSGEFYKLGIDEIFEISAMHGEGIGELLDAITSSLPKGDKYDAASELKLAIVGMPNVGKSSLTNALLGEDKNIVDSRPGTTRDSIDVAINWHGRRITLVDTAGIKRKSRSKDGVTVVSALKSLESIERCDVAVLMLDASRKISNQDVTVGSYPHKAGKGILVVFNKWDLIEKEDKTYREFEKDFRDRFAFLAYAPIMFVSALEHQRISKVIDEAWRLKEQREQRIPTADLNRFFEVIKERHPPPFHSGGTGRVYYGTQVETCPPTFALFVNKTKYFGRNYLRFLNNRLREAFPFDGTQIRIKLIEKKGRDEQP